MSAHEFEPAKLMAGLVVLGTGVVFVLDAVTLLRVPSVLVVPLLAGGLSLSWVVGAYGPRARRDARRTEESGAP